MPMGILSSKSIIIIIIIAAVVNIITQNKIIESILRKPIQTISNASELL
jgi:hypothetical protein